MDQHDNQHVEDDITHNYAHGLSKFDHPILQNITSKGNTFLHMQNSMSCNHVESNVYCLLQAHVIS